MKLQLNLQIVRNLNCRQTFSDGLPISQRNNPPRIIPLSFHSQKHLGIFAS